MMMQVLTEREKQIAAHLASGLRVAGVANELGLAENTVRNHLKHVFSKLDLHGQSELIEFLRKHPSIVSPYHMAGGLPAGSDHDLVDEILEVDRSVEKRIEEGAGSSTGPDRMKAILRTVLPLDETRRQEWRVRLAAHVVGPQQWSVRDAATELHQKWATKPLGRIAEFQARGWIRQDLDAEDVRRRLFSAIYAAALALLADGSPQEEQRQLAAIDRLLEAIAADSRSEQ